MPITITAQSGAVIRQNTSVAVAGCSAVKAYKQAARRLLIRPSASRVSAPSANEYQARTNSLQQGVTKSSVNGFGEALGGRLTVS
jgi:hypothetical protein